jgi:hypothetical protein
MKIILGCLIVVGIVFGSISREPKVQPVQPVISKNKCWDKCKLCEQKCGSDKNCKDDCWMTNDKCCQGVGAQGVYKMCGCTNKKRADFEEDQTVGLSRRWREH